MIERGDDPWDSSAPDDPDRLRGRGGDPPPVRGRLRHLAPPARAGGGGDRASRCGRPRSTCSPACAPTTRGRDGLPPAVPRPAAAGCCATTGIEELVAVDRASRTPCMRLYRSQQRLDELVPADRRHPRPAAGPRRGAADLAGRRAARPPRSPGRRDRGPLPGAHTTSPATSGSGSSTSRCWLEAQAELYAEMDRHIEALAAGTEPGRAGQAHGRAGRLPATHAPGAAALVPARATPTSRDVAARGRRPPVLPDPRPRRPPRWSTPTRPGWRSPSTTTPGRRFHLMVAYAAADELPDVVERRRPAPGARPRGASAPILDLHLWQCGRAGRRRGRRRTAAPDARASTGSGGPLHRLDVTITSRARRTRGRR